MRADCAVTTSCVLLPICDAPGDKYLEYVRGQQPHCSYTRYGRALELYARLAMYILIPGFLFLFLFLWSRCTKMRNLKDPEASLAIVGYLSRIHLRQHLCHLLLEASKCRGTLGQAFVKSDSILADRFKPFPTAGLPPRG